MTSEGNASTVVSNQLSIRSDTKPPNIKVGLCKIMFGCRDSDSKGDEDDAITFDFNELKMKIDKKKKKKEIE